MSDGQSSEGGVITPTLVPSEYITAIEQWKKVQCVTDMYEIVRDIIDNASMLKELARRNGITSAALKKRLVHEQDFLASLAFMLREDAQARTSRMQHMTGDSP